MMNSEDISKLSDFELNKAVAELIYTNGLNFRRIRKDNSGVMFNTTRVAPYVIDYCNNWNNLMPLVVEHMANVHLTNRGGHYLARIVLNDLSNSFIANGATQQRALAECLLMALQDEDSK